MKASEFDQKFDDGEDILEYLDLSQAKRPQYNHPFLLFLVFSEIICF